MLMLLLTGELGGQPTGLETTKRSISLGASKYCPLVCEEERRVSGLLVEIIRLLNERLLGFDLKIKMMPFGRALEESQKGTLAGVLGLFKTKDRESFMEFMKHPLLSARSCYYTHVDHSWVYKGVESLKKQRLITISGYKYEPGLQSYLDQHEGSEMIHEIFGDDEPIRALKFLALQRADVFIDNEFIVDHGIVQLGLSHKIKKVGCVDQKSFLYVGISKAQQNAAGLVEELNRAFQDIRSSPSYSNLYMPQ